MNPPPPRPPQGWSFFKEISLKLRTLQLTRWLPFLSKFQCFLCVTASQSLIVLTRENQKEFLFKI